MVDCWMIFTIIKLKYWDATRDWRSWFLSSKESVSSKFYHLLNMWHLYYADILLEKEVIKAAEIWDIFEKAPRLPQVFFLDFRKLYFCYWEIIIVCLLSHGNYSISFSLSLSDENSLLLFSNCIYRKNVLSLLITNQLKNLSWWVI